jgi:hypothetical protein
MSLPTPAQQRGLVLLLTVVTAYVAWTLCR